MSTFTISPRAHTLRGRRVTARDTTTVLIAVLVGVLVVVVTLAAGHMGLLNRMPVFKDAQQIQGVTEFLDSVKGYLLSIVLAGFTIALVGAGAAKLMGHTRANDLIFNVGVGVAIFASIPTLVA